MEEKQYKLIPMTFFWMFLGLLGTAIVAIFSYSTDLTVNLVQDGFFTFVLIGELIVVLLFSFLFRKLPPIVVTILYFLYAFINGLTLSSVFYVFELESIIILFFGAALMFGIMGFVGYKTNVDVSKWGTILMWTLIAGVVLSIINLFIGNSFLDILIDWFVLITMFGVTVYDLHRLKKFNLDTEIDENKTHIYFAMELYLDFINIFVRLLSLFGKRK